MIYIIAIGVGIVLVVDELLFQCPTLFGTRETPSWMTVTDADRIRWATQAVESARLSKQPNSKEEIHNIRLQLHEIRNQLQAERLDRMSKSHALGILTHQEMQMSHGGDMELTRHYRITSTDCHTPPTIQSLSGDIGKLERIEL